MDRLTCVDRVKSKANEAVIVTAGELRRCLLGHFDTLSCYCSLADGDCIAVDDSRCG